MTAPLRVRAGAALFRWRGLTPVPLLAAGLAVGRPTAGSLLCGAAIAFAGEVVRWWAVSHIGSVSRTRGVGVGRLVVDGPFSRTRNPLYLGNLLLGGGLAWATGVPALPALYVVLFFAQYSCIVAWEESRLAAAHGDDFRVYARAVPRWFPRPRRGAPATADGTPRWGARQVLRSERGTLVVQLAAWLAVVAVGWLRGSLAGG